MTSPLYLLDTNTVSYFVKGSFPELNSRIQQKPMESLVISTVTLAELRFWVSNRPEHARVRVLVDNFLIRVPALAWDAPAADTYGELKARLKQIGRPVAGLDLLIAAHSLSLNAILISHDQVFKQIPDLRTEDWVGENHND